MSLINKNQIIPKLYDTENTSEGEIVLYLKLFNPMATWYVAEYDKEKRMAYGYVIITYPEWGEFDLDELEKLGGMKKVSVDKFFKPTKFKNLKKGR